MPAANDAMRTQDAAAEPESRPADDRGADDQIPELLRATSPLLARAFAATGHQRSVLTQQGPTEQGPERRGPEDAAEQVADAPERIHDD